MDRNELQKIIAGIIDATRNKPDLAAEIITDVVVSGIDYNEIADYLAMYQPSEIGVQQLIFEKIEGWKFSLDKCMGGEYVNDTTEAAFDAWIEQPDSAVVEPDAKVEFEKYVDGIGGADNYAWHDYPVSQVFIDGFNRGRQTKPQRITEQNATDVYISAVEHFNYTKSFHPAAWLHMQGRTLLAKLNENREPDYKAVADELSNSSKNLLSIIESAGLINLSGGVQLGQTSWYAKAIDAVSWCKAAIAKHEGVNK